MKTVTLLEFRRQARLVLSLVEKGQSVLLTYRGKPVARLEPPMKNPVGGDDPFYSLDRIADPRAESLTSDDVDRLVYGA